MDGSDEAAAQELFFQGQVDSLCLKAEKGGMTLTRERAGMVLTRMEEMENAMSPEARRKRLHANYERWQRELTPEEEAAKVCAACIRPPQPQIACRLYVSGFRAQAWSPSVDPYLSSAKKGRARRRPFMLGSGREYMG